MPIPQFRLIATVERPSEARLASPGDAALVVRGGVTRALAMACPDGCGEVITINLDPRVGKAWRLYNERGGVSLYPSVWRDTGCKAHFVLWDSCILGIGMASSRTQPSVDRALLQRVLTTLPRDRFVAYWDVADALGAIPWAVEWCCKQLAQQKMAECQGSGNLASRFRRRV